MKTVEVSRLDLTIKVKNNLVKHQLDYRETMVKRRDTIINSLRALFDTMQRDEGYQPDENLRFPRPQDHSTEYERAIAMLEMSVSEIIELDQHEFDQLVLDNWAWKGDFLRTLGAYGG